MLVLRKIDDIFVDVFMIAAIAFTVTLVLSGVESLMHSRILSYLIIALEVEGIILFVSFLGNAFTPLRDENVDFSKKNQDSPLSSDDKISMKERSSLYFHQDEPQLDSDLIPIDKWYDEEKGTCIKAISKDGDNFTFCYKQSNEINGERTRKN